jgi:hypothetical protein
MKYKMIQRVNQQNRAEIKWYATPVNDGKVGQKKIAADIVKMTVAFNTFNTSIIRVMAVIVVMLAVSMNVDAQNKEIHDKIFGHIEKAKKATAYNEKLDAYAMALVTRDGPLYRGEISCSELEMEKIDVEMHALYKELTKMYDDLAKENKKPKLKPAKYEGCEKVRSQGKTGKVERELKLRGMLVSNDVFPMPKTYEVSADVKKKTLDLFESDGFREKLEQIGTVVKVVFLTNQWKEIKLKDDKWPYTVRNHFRSYNVGVLVKIPHEEHHRLYHSSSLTQMYSLVNGQLTDRYQFILDGYKFVNYKP